MTNIGRNIAENERVDRDAIHVAVLPCFVDSESMAPGERVKLVYGTNDRIISSSYDDQNCIGVVDPFIPDWSIDKGARVYVFLKPGLVSGMKHVWECSQIDNPPMLTSEAELWLRRFSEKWGFYYDEMISIATNPKEPDKYGEFSYITAMGVDLHSSDELEEDYHLFWQNLAILTGRTFDDAHKAKVGWSCSC